MNYITFSGVYTLGAVIVAVFDFILEYKGYARAAPDIMANAFLAYFCFVMFAKKRRQTILQQEKWCLIIITILISTAIQQITKLLLAYSLHSPLLFEHDQIGQPYLLQMSLYAMVNCMVVLFAFRFSQRNIKF